MEGYGHVDGPMSTETRKFRLETDFTGGETYGERKLGLQLLRGRIQSTQPALLYVSSKGVGGTGSGLVTVVRKIVRP